MGIEPAIDITTEQRKTVLSLLEKYLSNTTAWVYGSRAKWTARPQSDLDVVVFTTPEQNSQVFDLREAFEESNLPFRVDLFVWDDMPERFQKHIKQDYVVLMKKARSTESGWKTVTLGEFAPFTYGKGLPVGKRNPLGAIPVFGSNGVVGYHDSPLTDGPTIIIGRKGTVGAVHYSPIPCWPIDTTFFITGNDSTLVRFKYYALSMIGLEHMNSDSAVPGLNRSAAHVRTLLLPGESEQRAIAHILGTLDDKIELNRRMNETLEEMARALFKSWFVDFDPVRAKATLKQSTPLSRPSSITPPLGGSRRDKGVRPPARRWGAVRRQYTPQTLQKARALRQAQTDAEGLLWHYLRGKQLGGYKFRRQQPIGPYIADFACLSRKLLIEVDGGYHVQRKDYDEQRDRFLRNEGYRVLRFWNNEVFEDCFGVLEQVYAALEGAPPPPEAATPPQGGSDGNVEAAASQGGDWTVERARAYLDKMDPSIAALFPDHFVDSELGEVPAGWKVRPLADCFNLTMGQSPPGSTYNDDGEGLPFFQGCSDFEFRYPENRRFCTAPTRIAYSDDTLVSVRAPVGEINMAWEKCCIGRGVAALRHKSSSRSFTYYTAQVIQPQLRQYEEAGTVFGAINRKQFEILPVLAPKAELINCFETYMLPLEQRIRMNVSESRTLAALRDALLPKLMSGELRVEDGKKYIEGDL